MRIILIAIVLTLPTAFAAQAFEYRAPITKQLYACGQEGPMRIAAGLPDNGNCCVGQLRCTQFLATRSILKPDLDPRT